MGSLIKKRSILAAILPKESARWRLEIKNHKPHEIHKKITKNFKNHEIHKKIQKSRNSQKATKFTKNHEIHKN